MQQPRASQRKRERERERERVRREEAGERRGEREREKEGEIPARHSFFSRHHSAHWTAKTGGGGAYRRSSSLEKCAPRQLDSYTDLHLLST